MRAVLLIFVVLGISCGPNTPTGAPASTAISDAQRKETTDSVEALLERFKASMEHPDTISDPMEDFATTGEIAFASDGQLMVSRDSIRRARSEPTPPNVTTEFPVKKIEVLAPGVAAVTTSLVAQMDQGSMVAERAGVYTGVLAVRDGRIRILQQHLSMKPGTISPKPKAGASQ